jgi:DNA-directed RNA polymerase beta subunit
VERRIFMKKKYIYGFLCMIGVIIIVSVLVKYNYRSASTAITSSKNISLRDKDTIKLINTFKEPNGMYSTITGNENTYNGYNTIYCTLILNEIGIKTDNNIIKSIEKQSLFKDSDQDILNEIEKIYYANVILKNNKTTIPQYIKDDLKKIIKSDYHKEGYFISSNYVKYKDRPDFLLTKLNNTMLVLSLAKEFNLTNTIDESTTILWLNSVLRDKSTDTLPGKIYYISTCLNLLNKTLDINNKIVIDTSLLKNINDISALTQIQQYLLLCKQYSQKIDTPRINALKINLAASLKYKSNDPQVTYKKILILFF